MCIHFVVYASQRIVSELKAIALARNVSLNITLSCMAGVMISASG